jgi:hypothetical protein
VNTPQPVAPGVDPLRVADAAYPFENNPPGMGFAFYLNSGQELNAWSAAGVNEWLGRKKYVIPLWLNQIPGRVGTSDATEAVKQIRGFGLKIGAVGLDLESLVDPAYVHGFRSVILAAGGVTIAYGSLSTLFKNGAFYNWPADPGHAELLYPNCTATQYFWGPDYDLSVFDGVFADNHMLVSNLRGVTKSLYSQGTNSRVAELYLLVRSQLNRGRHNAKGC